MTKNPRAPGSLPSGVSSCSYLPSNFLGTSCARPSESPARGAKKNIRFHDHLLKALTFLAPLLRGVVVHSCVERDNKRLNYPKTSDYNEQMYSFSYVGNCSDYSKRTVWFSPFPYLPAQIYTIDTFFVQQWLIILYYILRCVYSRAIRKLCSDCNQISQSRDLIIL